MAATTFTVAVTGTHGTHNTTVPLECPTVAKLRSLGQYQLGAYATRYPLAQQVLAEKHAAEAAYEAKAAEREAAKASKGAKGAVKGQHGTTASTGNEPGAVDTAKRNTTPGTTVGKTTLETATVCQLVAELVGRHGTDAALDTLGNVVGNAIDAARAKLAKPAPKVDAPKVAVTPPAPKAATPPAPPAKMAAQTAKVDAPKATQEKAKATPAPKAKATCKATKTDGTPCQSTILGADGVCKSHTAKAEPTAKPVAPKAKPAPKADADPIIPGVFKANGQPMTFSEVQAAMDAFLEAATAPKAKKVA